MHSAWDIGPSWSLALPGEDVGLAIISGSSFPFQRDRKNPFILLFFRYPLGYPTVCWALGISINKVGRALWSWRVCNFRGEDNEQENSQVKKTITEHNHGVKE